MLQMKCMKIHSYSTFDNNCTTKLTLICIIFVSRQNGQNVQNVNNINFIRDVRAVTCIIANIMTHVKVGNVENRI